MVLLAETELNDPASMVLAQKKRHKTRDHNKKKKTKQDYYSLQNKDQGYNNNNNIEEQIKASKMEVRVADLLEKRERRRRWRDPSCVLQTKIMIIIIDSWGPIKSLCNVYVGFFFFSFCIPTASRRHEDSRVPTAIFLYNLLRNFVCLKQKEVLRQLIRDTN